MNSLSVHHIQRRQLHEMQNPHSLIIMQIFISKLFSQIAIWQKFFVFHFIELFHMQRKLIAFSVCKHHSWTDG